MDGELEVWQQQGLRLIASPEPLNAPDDPRVQRMEDEVFKLERTLNDLKFVRQQRQRQKAALEEEISVLALAEERSNDSGQVAEAVAVLSTLRERIQGCNQRLLAEGAARAGLERDLESSAAESRGMKERISEIQGEVDAYAGDCEALRVQIRARFHDVEKVLAQGKLMTMAEIQAEFQGRFRAELSRRQRTIARQQRVKDALREYEERVVLVTRAMQMQYDPARDTPRRTELKRKGISFEQVRRPL
jgi:chromosome segregation ATPase